MRKKILFSFFFAIFASQAIAAEQIPVEQIPIESGYTFTMDGEGNYTFSYPDGRTYTGSGTDATELRSRLEADYLPTGPSAGW